MITTEPTPAPDEDQPAPEFPDTPGDDEATEDTADDGDTSDAE